MMYTKNLVSCLCLLFISLLLVTACSSKDVVKDKDEGELDKEKIEDSKSSDYLIEVSRIYSWVNLMPGSDPRFNITGDFNLRPSGPGDNENFKLKRIAILQNDRTLFLINPTVREGEWNPDEGREFLFSTIKGILLTPDFNIDRKIDIELQFSDGENSFSHKIINETVEKVY